MSAPNATGAVTATATVRASTGIFGHSTANSDSRTVGAMTTSHPAVVMPPAPQAVRSQARLPSRPRIVGT